MKNAPALLVGRVLRVSIWAVAAAAFVSGFATPVGISAAALGCVCGTIAADRFSRLKSIIIVSAVLFAASTILVWLLGLLPLPVSIALYGEEFLDLFLKAAAVASLCRGIAACHSWFVGVECLVLSSAMGQWLACHRLGNLSRPYWVLDTWIEVGRRPEALFAVAGATIFGFIALYALTASRRKLGFPALSLATVLASGALCIIFFVPPLPFARPQPPPPPRSHAPEPPPPPPPQPTPLAWVQFKDLFRPPDRLSAYYFRVGTRSLLQGTALVTQQSLLEDGLPPNPTNSLASSTSTPAVVRTTVHTLVVTNVTFALLPPISIRCLPNPPSPYTQAYEVYSFRLGGSQADDLNLTSIRQQLLAPQWTSAESNLYMTAAADSNLDALAEQIVGGISEDYQDALTIRVGAIRQWLNNNMTLSCKAEATNGPAPVSEFLFKTKVGGYEHFATAAVLLFRAAGVPSRLGQGYVVGVNKDDAPSQFVITDAHAQTWPEVYLVDTGWLPVPLNPTNVLDRPNPPPEPELEKMLEQKLDPEPIAPARPGQQVWWLVVSLALVIVLLATLVWLNYIRWLNVYWAKDNERASRAMRTALILAGVAGWSIKAHENYPEFAARVAREGNAAFSDALARIAAKNRDCYERTCGSVWSDWQGPLALLNRHLGTTYLWRSWRLLHIAFLNARGSRREDV